MNLNVSSRKGRTYLYIEKSYRDENGKPRKKNVQTIGYDVTNYYLAMFVLGTHFTDKTKKAFSVDDYSGQPINL